MPLDVSTFSFVLMAGAFCWFFWMSYKKRDDSWTFNTFYMGTRNLGAPLTGSVFWGTSFSFANGIFYFSTLAYYKGLAVIWFQIPWMAAIWYLAHKLPQLIRITETHTLHGFLGHHFGRKATVAASLVTIVGFLGTVAFEINVSAELIARALHAEALVIPLTIISALAVVAYTDAGGFVGAAQTDIYQNRLGLGAALGILFVAIFLLGDFAPAAIDVSSRECCSLNSMGSSLLDFSNLDLVTIGGILCFATATNVVDMSNWQTISANSVGPNVPALQREMRRASFKILLAPAILGSLVGYAFRGVTKVGEPISDLDIIPALFDALSSMPLGFLWSALAALGLIAMAMSTIDSYLLSTSQTMEWDIRRAREKLLSSAAGDERKYREISAIRRARNEIYVMAFLACVIFIVARRWIGDQTVFVFQFAIFGAITALFPTTLYGLWLDKHGREPKLWAKRAALVSILGGLTGGLGVFAYAASLGVGEGNFNAYAWSPISTLSIAAIGALIAVFIGSREIDIREGIAS